MALVFFQRSLCSRFTSLGPLPSSQSDPACTFDSFGASRPDRNLHTPVRVGSLFCFSLPSWGVLRSLSWDHALFRVVLDRRRCSRILETTSNDDGSASPPALATHPAQSTLWPLSNLEFRDRDIRWELVGAHHEATAAKESSLPSPSYSHKRTDPCFPPHTPSLVE